jgi:hypothetical protein
MLDSCTAAEKLTGAPGLAEELVHVREAGQRVTDARVLECRDFGDLEDSSYRLFVAPPVSGYWNHGSLDARQRTEALDETKHNPFVEFVVPAEFVGFADR